MKGDAFGNVLALLYGLADEPQSRRKCCARCRSIACTSRIRCGRSCARSASRSALWRPYMARHRQNAAWQYHNGGIWPMVGGFWIAALVGSWREREARSSLIQLARACELDDWAFAEWLHGKISRSARHARAVVECRRLSCLPSTRWLQVVRITEHRIHFVLLNEARVVARKGRRFLTGPSNRAKRRRFWTNSEIC